MASVLYKELQDELTKVGLEFASLSDKYRKDGHSTDGAFYKLGERLVGLEKKTKQLPTDNEKIMVHCGIVTLQDAITPFLSIEDIDRLLWNRDD